jgi:hypothetical protein
MTRPVSMTPTVRVCLRVIEQATTTRGAYSALLEDEGTGDYLCLAKTQRHTTWTGAAKAALKLADRRGYLVTNRELVERQIAGGAPRVPG